MFRKFPNKKKLLYRSQMQRSANKKTHHLPHSLHHHNYTTGSLEDHDYTERGVGQVVELKEYEENSNNVEDKDYYFMDTTIIGWS